MAELEDVIRRAEEETHLYYRAHHSDFRNRGYHVMYGPPLHDAPILFMGYQPGGDQLTEDHCRDGMPGTWPDVSYYATEDWPLARNMRTMLGIELLRKCTGLNAIFFRSPKIEIYENEVSLVRRRDAAAFSVQHARQIVAALRPKLVVAIGFKTLDLFGGSHPALTNARGRKLLVESAIAQIPAIGTLHLSGCRIGTADRTAMAEEILGRAL